jgi:hypothetical protein
LGQKLKGQRPARKITVVITKQIKPRTFFLRLNKSISYRLKTYISHPRWDVKEDRNTALFSFKFLTVSGEKWPLRP